MSALLMQSSQARLQAELDLYSDNHRRNMAHPIDETGKILYSHFVNGWVYYQDNDTGEIIRNYLIACRNDSVIK